MASTTSNFSNHMNPVDISKIYDVAAIAYYKKTVCAIGTIGSIMSLFVIFTVFFKTPGTMTKIKSKLTIYAVGNFIIELTAALTEPVILPVHYIVYSEGVLKSTPLVLFVVTVMFVVMCIFGLLYIFEAMLLERYMAMSGLTEKPGIGPKILNFLCSVYAVVLCSVLLCALFVAPLNRFIKYDIDAREYIRKNVLNSEAFIEEHPTFVVFAGDELQLTTLQIVSVPLILYSVALFVLAILTIYTYRKHVSTFSQKTREVHKMLLTVVMIQMTTMSIFILLPGCVFLVLIKEESFDYIFFYVMVSAWTFPIADNLVILLTIKPYRLFLKSVFKRKVFRVADSQNTKPQGKMFGVAMAH